MPYNVGGAPRSASLWSTQARQLA